MQRLNTYLRTFSRNDRMAIKSGAFLTAVLSIGAGYWNYRMWRSKDFRRSHASYRISDQPHNGTPIFHMYKTWYRMPQTDYLMYHQFKPYYIQGYIDYDKEILIPRDRKINGIKMKGFDVYNPFYCFDDAKFFNVFSSMLFSRQEKSTKKKKAMTPQEDPSRSLKPSEIEHFRNTFKVFDINNDGTITIDELENVLRSMGQNPTREELVDLMNEADIDGNGSIDEHEFLIMMANRKVDEMEEHHFEAAFKVFDKNGDGSISHDEMKIVMKELGDEMTDKEIDDLIEEADEDGDGEIDYDEFCKMMTKHKRTSRARYKRLSKVMAFSAIKEPKSLTPKKNVIPEPGGLILHRGWIPWALRDKLHRPQEVHKGRIITVFGTFRPGKDIHDYKIPNNPYNNEWHNVALEDFVTYWEMANRFDNKYYYFQALQIGDQAAGLTPKDADGFQYSWPQPWTVDEMINDECEFKTSAETSKSIAYGLSALSAFSALLWFIA